MIDPTVGRIVLFHPIPGDNIDCQANDRVPAVVCKVWGPRMVNLHIWDANGRGHARTSVPLVQPGEPIDLTIAFCEWMPYQQAKAAKAEKAPAEKPVDEARSHHKKPVDGD